MIAAFDAFADHGYDGVSMRDLAARLGVSDSLLHHHFGSKEQMWAQSIAQVMVPLQGELVAALGTAEQADDPVARLRTSCRMALLWSLNHRNVLRLIFREGGGDSPRAIILRKAIGIYLSHADTVLKAAQDAGRMRSLPLETIHTLMLGVARQLVEPTVLTDRLAPQLENPEALKAFVDHIIEVMFAGLVCDP